MDALPSVKRCFLGLALPDATCHLLAGESARLRETIGHTHFRWIPARNFHLTLAFLGDLSAADIARLESLLAAQPWLDSPLQLTIPTLGGFPSVSRSRYVVAHIEPNPALDAIYRDLQQRLADNGYRTEARSLRAHITLARGTRQRPTVTVAEQRLTVPIEFGADELILFESQTGPEGSVYSRLAGFA